MYSVSYLIDGEWDYAYTGPADHPILLNLDPHKLAKNVALQELNSVVKILMLTSDHMAEVEERLRQLDVVVHVHGGKMCWISALRGYINGAGFSSWV